VVQKRQDVANGLKEIMKYHMNKLKKRLEVFALLAGTEDKDEYEEDKETKRQRGRLKILIELM
jgi:hypothetical protein